MVKKKSILFNRLFYNRNKKFKRFAKPKFLRSPPPRAKLFRFKNLFFSYRNNLANAFSVFFRRTNSFKKQNSRSIYWLYRLSPKVFKKYLSIFPREISKEQAFAIKSKKPYSYWVTNFNVPRVLPQKRRFSFWKRFRNFFSSNLLLHLENDKIFYLNKYVNLRFPFHAKFLYDFSAVNKSYSQIKTFFFKKKKVVMLKSSFLKKKTRNFLTKFNWFFSRFSRFRFRPRVTKRMRRGFRKNRGVILNNWYNRALKKYSINTLSKQQLKFFFFQRWWRSFASAKRGARFRRRLSRQYLRDTSRFNFLGFNKTAIIFSQLWRKFLRYKVKLDSYVVRKAAQNKSLIPIFNFRSLLAKYDTPATIPRYITINYSNYFFISKSKKLKLEIFPKNFNHFASTEPNNISEGFFNLNIPNLSNNEGFKSLFYKSIVASSRNLFREQFYPQLKKNTTHLKKPNYLSFSKFQLSLRPIKRARQFFVKFQSPYLKKGRLYGVGKFTRRLYRKVKTSSLFFNQRKLLVKSVVFNLNVRVNKNKINFVLKKPKTKIFYWYFTASKNNYRGQVSDSNFNVLFWATSYTAGERFRGSMARNTLAIETLIYSLFNKYVLYLKKNYLFSRKDVKHVILLNGPAFKFKKKLLNIFSRRKKKLEISQVSQEDKKYITAPRYIFSVAKIPFNGCFSKARRRRKNKGRNKRKKKAKDIY